MDYKYDLPNGRTLWFSSLHSKFWLGAKPHWKEPQYADTKLISLRLEISHQCNGYCKYCIVFGNHVEHFNHLSISKIWDWLNEQEWFSQIIDIFIIGGEPMLFFDDIAFLADHFKGIISFSTNGTLIDEYKATFLKEHNIRVYVSLDGPSRHHNFNRIYPNGQPMYDDIMRGLECLERVGTWKGIFMVAIPETVNDIAQIMIDLSNKYSLKRIGYSLPHWTEYEKNTVTPEQYRDALRNIYRNRKKIRADVMQINWRIVPLIKGQAKLFSCALHTQQTTLLPNKTIVRCSKIDQDLELSKYTNEDLNRGCPMELAKNMENTCANCVALSCCGGGCPFDGLKRFGCVIDKRECVITPPLIEDAIHDIVATFSEDNDFPCGEIPSKKIASILLYDREY